MQKTNHTFVLAIFETNSLKNFDEKTSSEDKQVMKKHIKQYQ